MQNLCQNDKTYVGQSNVKKIKMRQLPMAKLQVHSITTLNDTSKTI